MATNINPTPKAIFMSSNQNIASHKRMIETSEFQRAIQVAQLQYVRVLHNLAQGKNLNDPGFATGAAMCFERLQGSQEIIDIMLKLAEPMPTPEVRVVGDNLEHKN